MKVAYPELLSSANFIARICLNEEERFASTLAAGLRYFHQYVEEARSAGKTRLTGAEAFKLYDTFGFPLDLSQELAAEQKMDIDNDGFERELEEQRERARSSWRGDEKRQERKTYEEMKGFPVRYIGYETSQAADARVLAILIKGARAPEISEGQEGEIVLDRTPFYAEAGGQAGDTGWLRNPHFSAAVENTYFPIPEIIAQEVKVISGRLREGDLVDAEADAVRRKAISINHTATHLLHAALRQVLGDHVKQAGSLVSPARLRFDFTHFAALSQGELARVEQLVNEKIREDAPVSVKVTTLDDGLKEGAMAIFEEKYGERVRMISIADFSKELCGGVHAHSTGEIGFFQIISETSVAAGMRRIEALTGDEALKHIQEAEALLEDIEQTLGVPRKDILSHIEKLRSQLKEKEKENKSLRQKLMSQRSPGGEEKIREVKGIRVITQKVEGLNTTEVRELADALKQKAGSGVVILGAVEGKKAFLVVAVTKNLTSRLNASELIQELAPLVGGGGGGRADFAQAGGGKPEGLDRALESALKIIEKRLDVYPEG
jgi:alanyl-tRNA synthetase